MARRKLIKKTIFILLVMMLLLASPFTFAYWQQININIPINYEENISIGSWEFENDYEVPTFDSNKTYDVGEIFMFEGYKFQVTQSWFNPKNFINSDGSLNTDYLKPYGPVNELTDQYRTYNTYRIGDIVRYLGEEWIVRHEGANSVVPGSDTNAWNRINNINYYEYNTYEPGDIVLYNNKYYKNISTSRNISPNTSWAWTLIN